MPCHLLHGICGGILLGPGKLRHILNGDFSHGMPHARTSFSRNDRVCNDTLCAQQDPKHGCKGIAFVAHTNSARFCKGKNIKNTGLSAQLSESEEQVGIPTQLIHKSEETLWIWPASLLVLVPGQVIPPWIKLALGLGKLLLKSKILLCQLGNKLFIFLQCFSNPFLVIHFLHTNIKHHDGIHDFLRSGVELDGASC